MNDPGNKIPTLEEFMGQFEFKRPNYFDDSRTPKEMKEQAILDWRQSIEGMYLELYGDLSISSMLKKTERE